MPLTDADLAAIEARISALAVLPPPPWGAGSEAPTGRWVSAAEVYTEVDDAQWGRCPTLAVAWDREDLTHAIPMMEFFAHARQDVPALLTEVRELRRVLGVIQHRAHTGRRGPLLDLNEIGHLALQALGVTTTGGAPTPEET